MNRITNADLERTLSRWLDCIGVPEAEKTEYHIETWRPGDGLTRYRVVSYPHHDVCPYYSQGARAFYNWLWAGIYMTEERERRERQKAAAWRMPA